MSGNFVIVDYDALCRFMQELEESTENVRKQLEKTDKALETAGETWKDVKFKQFNDRFSEDKERLEPISKQLEQYKDEVLEPYRQKLYEYLNN